MKKRLRSTRQSRPSKVEPIGKENGGDHLPIGPQAIREFYDDFSQSRMQSYLREKNLRIERAIARILPFVQSESTILEIGCGLGLVTERIGEVASKGSVWACDISEKNISQARERINQPHIHFRRADVLNDFQELRRWISQPLELVVMVDVLEHLPLETHSALFKNLRTVMKEDSTVVITFPSAQYQRFLRENKPTELQIIDEVIELPHFVELVAASGFIIRHFSLEDVWLKNQYAHCVLKTSVTLDRVTNHDPGIALAIRELGEVIQRGGDVILVDEAQWDIKSLTGGNQVVPFLEKDGQYWGLPSDDKTAIAELKRMQRGGAAFIAFGWPTFWWLSFYKGFHRYLRANCRCLLENERVMVFDLRS